MFISKVTYGRKFNLGNYESESIEVEVTPEDVDEHMTERELIEYAKAIVEAAKINKEKEN